MVNRRMTSHSVLKMKKKKRKTSYQFRQLENRGCESIKLGKFEALSFVEECMLKLWLCFLNYLCFGLTFHWRRKSFLLFPSPPKSEENQLSQYLSEGLRGLAPISCTRTITYQRKCSTNWFFLQEKKMSQNVFVVFRWV